MTVRHRILSIFCWGAVFSLLSFAQTTQGLISGRIVDSEEGVAIEKAQVSYINLATNTTGAVRTGASGYYVAPLLPPGTYRIRVSKDGYQSQELQELGLPVASSLEVNFRLRPLRDVWEEGQYRSVFLPGTRSVLTFYGPDVDSSHSAAFETNRGKRGGLESTVSTVIDPLQVRDLPLSGRDIYTTLVLQPGVTADTSTARGLGFSINGQRPSASNYLLDGVENNNYLITGPLNAVAPEAVQEYRVSTNNFSAEYGRASGFIANAVTRSGASKWHGLGYYYTKNDALNANDFQQNRQGLPRTPLKEAQPGVFVGGPIIPKVLFASGSFEYFRFRSFEQPLTFELPTTNFITNYTTPNSVARKLLAQYPAPPVSSGQNPSAAVTMSPTSTLNRYLASPRADYLMPGGIHRLMGRLAIARVDRPDVGWTPYKDFLSPLTQNTFGLSVAATSSVRPSLTNEARLGWNADDLRFQRPHPEIPTLAAGNVFLPGSPSFYSLRNHTRYWEFLDNMLWARGRHLFKFGGEFLLRRVGGFLNTGSDGYFGFPTVLDFGADSPAILGLAVSRENLQNSPKPPLNLTIPDFNREYRYNEYFAFAQDTFKATPRLALNYGVRYENYGAPVNTGPVKDGMIQLGSGADFSQRLVSAKLNFPHGGNQQMYSSDNNDWAARVGFSYSLQQNSKTVLRGAYGIFYDRPFDNLWQNFRNNNVLVGFFPISSDRTDFLAPVATLLPNFRNVPITQFDTGTIELTLYQPGIRNGYVNSYFMGIQRQLTNDLTLEVNGLGALGRKLVTTDIVNRPLSIRTNDPNNNLGYLNPALPRISYRSSQGSSNYSALTVLARYRTRRAQFQLAYTWSHSIDNQSEPLAGAFDFTELKQGGGQKGISAFARQFDSRADRGNSDFDQRHNLVFFSIWELPAGFASSKAAALFRGWKFAEVAAFRTGFPYTVGAPSTFTFDGESIENNRADVVDPGHIALAQPVSGGKRLLNLGAFRAPVPGRLGSSGRNALSGPGLFNIDLSLSRSFGLKWLGESGRLTFRADAFNVLNHANLNNPTANVGSPDDFGIATYGRKEENRGFPLLTPFRETARQIQLLFRIEF